MGKQIVAFQVGAAAAAGPRRRPHASHMPCGALRVCSTAAAPVTLRARAHAPTRACECRCRHVHGIITCPIAQTRKCRGRMRAPTPPSSAPRIAQRFERTALHPLHLPHGTAQAMMDMMATSFPGAFAGYKLRVIESHQSTKKDTSGTAKAVVASFQVRARMPCPPAASRLTIDWQSGEPAGRPLLVQHGSPSLCLCRFTAPAPATATAPATAPAPASAHNLRWRCAPSMPRLLRAGAGHPL